MNIRFTMKIGIFVVLMICLNYMNLLADSALDFDGVDDYGATGVESSLNMSGSSFTIEVWIKAEAGLTYNGERLLIEYGSWETGTYQLTTNNDGDFKINFHGRSSADGCTGTADWSDGTWHHLAGVLDASANELRVYFDGALVNTVTENNTPENAELSLYLASRGGSEKFSNVTLDEVRIWKDARTQTELQDNMNIELSGTENNLVAYYQLNEGSGSSFTDNSNNSNNGSLSNMDDTDWVTPGVVLAVPPSGSGSSGDPYFIATLNNLYWITQNTGEWDKYYQQTANIDASSTPEWDDGAGFLPIGNSSNQFTGEYDGNSYTIDDLFIDRSGTDYIGLFGYGNGADIKNISVTNVDITGDQYVAGLTGYVNGSTTINGCSVDGTVNGRVHVAGCIGLSNSSGSITDSHFSGTINADNSDGNQASGGFVGEKVGSSTISLCSTSGTISGNGRNLGGFVGWHDNGSIELSYSTMNVSNSSASQGRIGGFAGAVANYDGTFGTVYNCYSTGDVSVPNSSNNSGSGYGIGGFVGSYYDGGNNKIYYSYATGSVSAPNASANVGGFSGEENDGDDGGIGNFWDTETSGWATSYEEGTGETGATTVEMKTLDTFTDAGWDFVGETANGTDDYWDMDYSQNINSGYPYLYWGDGDDQSLPVELAFFSATAGDGEITLRWVTESEINNEAFLIERRIDGETFELLAEIEGQGTKSYQTRYAYTDRSVFNGQTYYYRLADRDYNGVVTYHNTIHATPYADNMTKTNNPVIKEYVLKPAYPNPFNPETNIHFNIPNNDDILKSVSLEVFNILGQKVATLYEGEVNGGQFKVKWDGRNDNGIQQPNGMYLIRFQSERFVQTRKITLMR